MPPRALVSSEPLLLKTTLDSCVCWLLGSQATFARATTRVACSFLPSMPKRERREAAGSQGAGQKVVCTVEGQLVCLEFGDKEVMAQALGRVSAYSEGKGKKGQKADSDEVQNRGYFGHNFPMTTLHDFFKLNKDRLTGPERDFIALLKRHGGLETAYLIAYLKNDYKTKLHEMQHARFYLDEGFREQVATAWNALPDKQRSYLTDFLSRLGYHPDVHLDEFQAYHFTERANFWGIKVDLEWEG